ncbi:MAG TPA: choice-of-anchor tandem repeat GloVer-containing protein [Candidatus Sulfotelmatobacter sp.]|nr:choice-of-anchor tandem repeat GloVer-containing protein [Candidatus Sulfotelmatobacter sp.]
MKHIRTFQLVGIAAILFLPANAAIAQTYTPLYTYPIGSGAYSGIVAPSLLSQGQDGDLYSTISNNGSMAAGSVYKVTTSGQYSLLYSFCAEGGHCLTTGGGPNGGVTLGFDGNLWGTTLGGGKNNAGTVFKMTPAGTLTSVYSFANGNDDSVPVYPVFQGQDGNMYGVSVGEYNGQYGSFLKLTTKGAATAHPFSYTNGADPSLPTQGTDGNFYGTTQFGGDATCKCGVVYKATAGGKITVLHKFTGYPNDGYRPYGVVVQGYDGNFYGITFQGGANNEGTVFKISPSGAYTLLHSFLYAAPAYDGASPIAGLTLGTDGNLYGSTSAGGTKNAGMIYKITTAGVETKLYDFCAVACTNGFGPRTPMVLHTDGKFYGNTSGNSLGGSVYYSLDMGLTPFVRLVTWTARVGATAEILGQGLSGTSSVSFNGTRATSFKVISDTYLTATVPVGARTGSVSVVASGGTLTSDRNFLVVPTIKSISPTSGPVATAVTIAGSGLIQATKVTFGGGKTAAFTVNNDSQITATVPGGAKTGKIVVTTPGGTATSPTSFTVTL